MLLGLTRPVLPLCCPVLCAGRVTLLGSAGLRWLHIPACLHGWNQMGSATPTRVLLPVAVLFSAVRVLGRTWWQRAAESRGAVSSPKRLWCHAGFFLLGRWQAVLGARSCCLPRGLHTPSHKQSIQRGLSGVSDPSFCFPSRLETPILSPPAPGDHRAQPPEPATL